MEKYKNHRVLVVGAGRGNPFPGHYGMEQSIDKINGEYLAYTDPDLKKKAIAFRPTHIITYANVSRNTSRIMSEVGKLKSYKIPDRELRMMKKKNIEITPWVRPRMSWWFWDLRHADGYKAFTGWMDKIFLCNKEFMGEWHDVFKKPVYYMPQCATDNVLYKEHSKDDVITWDIFFMGSPGNAKIHGDRKAILEGLAVDYKVELKNGTIREQRVLYNKKSSYFYSNSKFCLDISAPASGYTSNRPYEILANKGLLLIKWFPGIEDIFENHKHVIWFKNLAEVKKEIDFYIDKPKERAKIIEAGHQLFLEKHTFDARLHNILDIMDGTETEYRGYLNEK